MARFTRRRLLGGVVATTGVLAGCTASGGPDDSDGDGVPDDADYAPKDPAVQSKEDVQGGTAEPGTETRSATPTATPTPTPTPTPTGPGASDNAITDTTGPDTRTNLVRYGSRQVEVALRGFPEFAYDPARVLVQTFSYPRGDALAKGISDPIADPPADGSETTSVTVELTEGEIPAGERVHHMVFASRDLPLEDVSPGDVTQVCESDPFVLRNGRVERDEPRYFPGSVATDAYDRDNNEGAYDVDVSGSTGGTDWLVDMFVYGSVYSRQHERQRPATYTDLAAQARSEGVLDAIAGILGQSAGNAGIGQGQPLAEYVVDVVQSLPSLPDGVAAGVERPKFPTETLIEGGGDSEDAALLAALVLQRPPFEFETVVVSFADHVIAGVALDQYPGDPGWHVTHDGTDYYTVETTDPSMDVGDLPERYQSASGSDFEIHDV